jgi:uncharacterized protein
MKYRYMTGLIQERAAGRLGRLVVLSGARQVGKTTLVRHAFPDYQYVSLDDPAVRPSFSAFSAQDWIARYPRTILDEVQKVPALIESIKAAYDGDADVRYILLGSSQLLLMEQVRESLAGRVRLLNLWPLTLPEMISDGWDDVQAPSRFVRWLLAGGANHEILQGVPSADAGYARACQAWERYLSFGGMPVLHDATLQDEERWLWLKDYRKTYLERDVRDLAAFRDLEPFVTAQQALAQRTGGILNASDAARVTGVAPNTLRRFIRYLEMSFQVRLLPPYFRNAEKRLAKAPKLHFLDPGMLRAITGRRKGLLTGAEFESAVVAEMIKQVETAGLNASFMHLRTHDGREVDLLIELEEGFVAVEIKQSQHVSQADAKALRGLESFLDRPLLAGLLVSNDPEIRVYPGAGTAVPAAWLLGG